MSEFSFETMAQEIAQFAKGPNPEATIQSYLQDLVKNPEPLIEASAKLSEAETQFHEDDNVSVWHCRFQPDEMVPAHEHLLKVFIAGFSGQEKSLLYKPATTGLEQIGEITAGPGDVIMLEKDAIHSVIADGDAPSEAIHVYLGPLMSLKRDLYDWDSGKAVDFTMEAFEALKRPV